MNRHRNGMSGSFLSWCFLALSLLCFTSAVYADNVDFKTALRIARRYVTVGRKASKVQKTRSAVSKAPQPYYVFNDAAGKGFVVVAGDDRMGEVLAYGDEAAIDMDRLSPEARYLFEAYRQVFEILGKDKRLTTRAAAATAAGDHVEPLVSTKWSQFEPYNLLVGGDYPTGCVATAVAQVMCYHRWPEQGKGQASYRVTYDNTVRSADFSQSHYDWGHMLPDYAHVRATEQQNNAVAKLMSDVGIATAMQYTPASSGTQDYLAERALRDYFDYDASLIGRSDEGAAHFVEILKKEIRNGFPLYMSGMSAGGGGGHAWVCDGFDSEDRFHMNLGWGGQANGYYSVTALNITSTGSEFGGKPLTFNRSLHVIAIHPNKPNTPKIDADIAYKSPNIAFRLGSEMAFEGKAPAVPAAGVKLMYKDFTNQSNDPFMGDIGVGIYDADGRLTNVFPYSQKGKGIFTKVRFVYNDEKMTSGAVIDEEIPFTLDFSALANGTYTLSPIVARLQEDGTLGTWVRMKKAPRVVMKVADGKIDYLELPSKTPAYQLAADPQLDGRLIPGEENRLLLPIRKLDAQVFDGTVKVELVDGEGTAVYTSQTENKVDFDMYATTRVRLPFTVPYGTAAGEYRVRVTIVNADGNTCRVNDRPLHGPYKVTVEDGKKRDVFATVRAFVQDNNEESIRGEGIDVKKTSTFRVSCMAFLGKNVHYKGSLTLYLIDTQTEFSIPVMKRPLQVDLSSAGLMTQITSDWIDPRKERLINNRRYRVALIGEEDGRNVDLIPASSRPTFISVVNNDVTDGIDTAHAKDVLRFTGGRLSVQRQGLKSVEVYGLNGVRVAGGTADASGSISLSLLKGTYVVRVTTQEGCYSAVIR